MDAWWVQVSTTRVTGTDFIPFHDSGVWWLRNVGEVRVCFVGVVMMENFAQCYVQERLHKEAANNITHCLGGGRRQAWGWPHFTSFQFIWEEWRQGANYGIHTKDLSVQVFLHSKCHRGVLDVLKYSWHGRWINTGMGLSRVGVVNGFLLYSRQNLPEMWSWV